MKQDILKRYEFRYIKKEEAEQAAEIEQACFPPNEANSREDMKKRVEDVAELFLVAVDKECGKIAGLLTGIATNEERFQDAFFTETKLHNPDGKNVMILSLDVLEKYRGQGLARALMEEYFDREEKRGRKNLVLTCLQEKVEMYQRMGFVDLGLANSTWGGEEWHEMRKNIN